PQISLRLVQLLAGDVSLVIASRGQHHLREPDRAHRAGGSRVEVALELHESERELRIDTLGCRCLQHVRGEVGRNPESARVMDDAIRALILGPEQIHLATGGVKLLAKVARAASHARKEAGVRGYFGVGRPGMPGCHHGGDYPSRATDPQGSLEAL